MKFFIVFAALFAVALAAPNRDAEIIKDDRNVEPLGYQFQVETSDGKSFQEDGNVEDVGTEDEAIVVRGSYQYVGDDGQTYRVDYIADKNGFQPKGAHLPEA